MSRCSQEEQRPQAPGQRLMLEEAGGEGCWRGGGGWRLVEMAVTPAGRRIRSAWP